MEIIAQYGTIFLVMACLFGFFMAWGIGANDVANAMGTSVGSRALTIKQAILVAMIFEFAGAYLAGGEVTSTIRKGIIDADQLSDNPDRPCHEADSIARRQLKQVELRMARLKALRTELRRMIHECSGGNTADCKVLEVLRDHSECLTDHNEIGA